MPFRQSARSSRLRYRLPRIDNADSAIPRFVAFLQNSRSPIRQFTSLRHFIAWLAFVAASALLMGALADLSSRLADSSSQEPEPTAAVVKIARYVPPPTPTRTQTPTVTLTVTPTLTLKLPATVTRSATPMPKPTRAATPSIPSTAALVRSQLAGRTMTATLVTAPTATVVSTSSLGERYGLLPALSANSPIHSGDLNLAIRGFVPISATHALVDYAGESDGAAPQLAGLFADSRTPSLVATYQLYEWNAGCDCRGGLVADYAVTLVGLGASPGEILRVPDSGYDIGGGFEALVVYADPDRIVLTFTRSESVIRGYALYVESVSVDGNLVALYQQANSAGRGELPAVRSGQGLGKAKGTEVRVAIRDSGAFLDPRSRKDWWRGR